MSEEHAKFLGQPDTPEQLKATLDDAFKQGLLRGAEICKSKLLATSTEGANYYAGYNDGLRAADEAIRAEAEKEGK